MHFWPSYDQLLKNTYHVVTSVKTVRLPWNFKYTLNSVTQSRLQKFISLPSKKTRAPLQINKQLAQKSSLLTIKSTKNIKCQNFIFGICKWHCDMPLGQIWHKSDHPNPSWIYTKLAITGEKKSLKKYPEEIHMHFRNMENVVYLSHYQYDFDAEKCVRLF